MFSFNQILKQLSFSEAEASVYLASLSLGKAKASDIAKKAGMNRTAAYFNIKNLLAKGLMNEIKIGRALHFSPIPPAELADQFQKLANNLKSVVPQLESLNKIENEVPGVEITESQLGYFKVYDQISSLPEGSTFRVIEGKTSYIEELSLLTEEQLEVFFSRIVEKKIKTKGIFTRESLNVAKRELSPKNLKLTRNRIWQLRSLSEKILPLQNLAHIYGNKASFLFPETSLVVTIKHQGIADTLVAMFDAIFNFAEEIKDPWK